jgi:hypothetical protein
MIASDRIRAVAIAAIAVAGWAEVAPSVSAEPEGRSPAQATSQLTERESALGTATRTLREAAGEEAQQVAREQLLTAIRNYFDADLAARRRQLVEIETRLTKLKGELDRHLASKGEVIQRQLKDIEKDDAGLGLYSRDEMSTLLANYFDADMKIRQGKLADMADRAKSLHAQLDKRQAARDEIIQLQLNVLVNEAAGLGFYSPTKGNGT